MSENIIKVKDIKIVGDNIILVFTTNDIEISTLVKDTQELPSHEIISKGYSEVKPHIDMEYLRLGLMPPTEIEFVDDEYIHIELLGVIDVHFDEGQNEIVQPLRCIGYTKFGKKVDITNEAIFNIENNLPGYGLTISGKDLHISATQSGEFFVNVQYNSFTDKKSFVITFLTTEEIAEQQAEAMQKMEEERLKRLEELKLTKIAEIQKDCNTDILNGFTCYVKGENRTFGFEFDDQINLISQLTIFTANQELETVVWKCKGLEGMVDIYTKLEFVTICQAAENAKRNKIARFWELKQSALSATTEDEVNGISW